MIHSIWFNSSSSHHVVVLKFEMSCSLLQQSLTSMSQNILFPVTFKLKWNLYYEIFYFILLFFLNVSYNMYSYEHSSFFFDDDVNDDTRRHTITCLFYMDLCFFFFCIERQISVWLLIIIIRIIFCLNLDICMKVLFEHHEMIEYCFIYYLNFFLFHKWVLVSIPQRNSHKCGNYLHRNTHRNNLFS